MKKTFFVSMLLSVLVKTGVWAQVVNNGCSIFIDSTAIVYVDHSFIGLSNAQVINNGNLYITGDITNNATDGLFEKTATGTVFFVGKNQRIDGNNSVTFAHLSLNEHTKTSSVPVNIIRTLDLGKAVLVAEDEVIIGNDHPGAIQRLSGFIATQKDGQLVREVSQDNTHYPFPLGSLRYGTYQPVDVVTQTSGKSLFAMALYDYDPGYNGMNVLSKEDGIDKVNDRYYYAISRLGGNQSASLAFYSDSTSEKNMTGVGIWSGNNEWAMPYKASALPGSYGDNLNHQFLLGNPTFIETYYTPVFTIDPEITKYLQIPNSFTANGDGLNEYWELKGIDRFPNNHVVIYNRWGEAVYETTGYSAINHFDGEGMMQGVYMYVVNVSDNKGNHETFNGDLTILR